MCILFKLFQGQVEGEGVHDMQFLQYFANKIASDLGKCNQFHNLVSSEMNRNHCLISCIISYKFAKSLRMFEIYISLFLSLCCFQEF